MARAILDAVPSPLLVVDADLRLHGCNRAALELLGPNPLRSLRRKTGEILHCIRSMESTHGCGRAHACPDCVIRNSVGISLAGRTVHRQSNRMKVRTGAEDREIPVLVTTAPFDLDGRRLILLILEDIGELVALRQALPICASCKKIRDDREYWTSVEAYFKRHLDVSFSHGMCPDCVEKFYPGHRPASSSPTQPARA